MKKHPILGVWYASYKKFPEGPIVLGGPRWVTFSDMIEKIRFCWFHKKLERNNLPQIEDIQKENWVHIEFSKKIWCILKLGNIFKSPIHKKNIFERALCKK